MCFFYHKLYIQLQDIFVRLHFGSNSTLCHNTCSIYEPLNTMVLKIVFFLSSLYYYLFFCQLFVLNDLYIFERLERDIQQPQEATSLLKISTQGKYLDLLGSLLKSLHYRNTGNMDETAPCWEFLCPYLKVKPIN